MKHKTPLACVGGAFLSLSEMTSTAPLCPDRENHCGLLTQPVYLYCYCKLVQQSSFFLPKNVHEPEKKTNVGIGLAFLLVWWPQFGWNRDPYMTCSHKGKNHGKVRCILTPAFNPSTSWSVKYIRFSWCGLIPWNVFFNEILSVFGDCIYQKKTDRKNIFCQETTLHI